MANRFPLILNTSSNQIQELASGDTLDLTGSGLNLTGITTLSTSAELNLGGGTNINTGTRGDILFYNSSNTIQKLSLGAAGKVLQSNGTDLVYGSTGSVANVYYVSPSGTDGSGFGTAIDTAFKTIKYAVSNIGTPSATSPAIIFVKAGVYEETSLPIVVPAHTTIAGDSLRATIIKPKAGLDSGGSIQNNRSVMFRMSNATVLQDLVMDGMGGYTPGSPAYKPENATIGGTYLALNAASVISTKSPYIYNCTSFGNGATGAVLDGALHSSGNRSMLFHTYTAVHSDGLGILLKANANAEMISTFTYYCTIGFACLGGSKIRSLNSSNAYGEYAVYSAGFDTGETANQGTVKGTMLTYTNVLTQDFTAGEQITGGTSGATAYAVNVQAEPKRIYIVQKSGTFQANETVTGGSSGATATLASASFETNQSGRILVTTFASSADAGDSLQFASTDGNAYQIQSVSSVTANSVAYHVLVFSTSRATPVPTNTTVNVRKEFSLIRLTGHDFLQVGTGGTDTTNWPNNPTQNPAQADQVITNETDPGRVYYTATDELGNFYVGDQFKVDQATGNVTLDASAFNLSGLESLRLGSVGGLIGAAVGEFSTDVTLSQDSDTKVSTQRAVKTYVDTLDDVTPSGGTFTVAGISTVTGTTHFTKQLNVSGISTFHGNVNLLDGDRLRVGSSEDLQLYHDGNNSFISENGSGDLKIQASAGSILLQKSTGEEMIKAIVDGAVELSHDNVLRLSTTSTGINVTGNVVGDGLTIDGDSDLNGDLDVDGHTNLDNVSVAGVSTFAGAVNTQALTATSGTFSGNVSIGGTLTYEDVTNIDSVGIVTAREGIFIPDSKALHIGNAAGSGDLRIFSNGTESYVDSYGGNFYIRVTDQSGGVENKLIGRPNAQTELYYNDAKKLQTDNTGITVTGTAVATTFSGSGASLTNLPAAQLSGTAAAINGSNITNLNGSAIASGTVPVARIGTGTKNTSTFYRGDGTFATVTAPAITAINNASDNRIVTSNGGTTVNAESNLNWNGTTLVVGGTHSNNVFLTASGNALTFGGGSDVANYSIGTNMENYGGNYTKLDIRWHTGIRMGAQQSYGGIRFYDSEDLGTVKFSIMSGADAIQAHTTLRPSSNNSYNLGTSSLRWANIYTNDLNLSNEGKTNDVDGTWGNYTIQEGESDLFLINRRNGKKYKFNLTEVS